MSGPETGAVAYIGVGSNLAAPDNVMSALELLAREVDIDGISTFYRSAALERPEQPEFLNGVFRARTDASPRALKFSILRGIEERLGRRRTADKHAPRTIDLDVLIYGNSVCSDPDLRIPDPDIRVRPFVAVPLLELARDLVLPDSGERLESLPVIRQAEGLRPDMDITRKLRQRLGHELGSRGGVGA